jgi:hypothetical protein
VVDPKKLYLEKQGSSQSLRYHRGDPKSSPELRMNSPVLRHTQEESSIIAKRAILSSLEIVREIVTI